MDNISMNLKITLPRSDYNLDYVDEILEIDENEYKLLNCGEIEVSTKYFPSAIDPGDVYVNITLLVNEIRKDPILANLFSSALYDLYKFLLLKSKVFLKGNKHGQKVIGIGVHGTVIDKNSSHINFDINCNSENVIEIIDKFKKINDFIESKKFKTVNILYDQSTDAWKINNKCDNNITED